MMETIRVTADEQRRIAAAAAASPQKYKQGFCLAAIMEKVEQWERTPEPEPPIPKDMVRLHPFQQPAFDLPRTRDGAALGPAVSEVSQYQAGGQWYFNNEKGDVIGVWNDAQMQKFIQNPPLPTA